MDDNDRSTIDTVKRQINGFATNPLTDFEYVKRLEENNYDVDKTVTNIRQYLKHTNSFDFTKWQNSEYREVMDKYHTYGFINKLGKVQGVDQLVYIDTLGTLDVDGVLRCVSPVEFYLHRFHCAEYILRKVRQREREIGRRIDLVFIYDLDGVRYTAHNLSLLTGAFLHLSRLMLKYYATMSSKIVVINVAHIGSALYNAFRPLLSEKTRKKIFVLGNDWKTEILDHTDPNILPVFYGGNLVDENQDPKCQQYVVYGCKVPSNLYYIPSKDDSNLDQFKKLAVKPGKAKYLTFEVDKIGCSLEWIYGTNGSDYGFGIFFTEDETCSDSERMEMVFPQIDHLAGQYRLLEKGEIKCKKIGFYKLWFSNSFSWIAKLNVHYKISVLKPRKS